MNGFPKADEDNTNNSAKNCLPQWFLNQFMLLVEAFGNPFMTAPTVCGKNLRKFVRVFKGEVK